MKYSLHPSAREELLAAYDYYEECQPGLGQDFIKEVYSTIQRIIQLPDAWTSLSQNTKRCLTNRFPFGIIYTQIDGVIQIVAIMHLKRKPGYWGERL